MKRKPTIKTKPDFGKVIRELMVRENINTTRELVDRINRAADERIVSPTSVGKWLAGETVPKATSLMFLAKALNVSADLILFGDDDNPKKLRELTKLVTAIVQAETKKIFSQGKVDLENELALVLRSKNIPQEDKESLIRQARNLLKLYEKNE